jgi:hypothetical protein
MTGVVGGLTAIGTGVGAGIGDTGGGGEQLTSKHASETRHAIRSPEDIRRDMSRMLRRAQIDVN